jgi:outer membrane protein OmpA-like peptidoglycan-associated protein
MMYTLGKPAGALNHFLRFVLGPKGQTLVRENGFVPSDTAAALIASLADDTHTDSAAPPTVKRIWFSGGGTRLDASSKTDLRDIAATMQRDGMGVIVVGHADAAGDASANDELAQSRALTVATFFRDAGIDASRIEIQSGGESAPIASNQTTAGRAENRRVDLYLIQM